VRFQNIKLAIVFGAFASLLFASCTRKQAKEIPRFKINLYSGVEGLAKLGYSEMTVLKSPQWEYKEILLTSIKEAEKFGFNRIVEFPDIGMRVYFRRRRAALIEVQEPFKGDIVGKKLALFTFSLPPANSWRDELIKHFGHPQSEASGGRLGSRAIFYPWGDVTFNRMGPNELALHRNPKVAEFRRRNFGRLVKLFGN